ncbi:MAG TPA: MarR family winged helix-turn-helix transcriptional regulator [Variovorax sp.]
MATASRPSPRARKTTATAAAGASAASSRPAAARNGTSGAEALDTRVLEGLVGYNTRRAYLVISATFAERMAVYGMKPVDFSVLSLLAHNPGATSRQLCATLDILPPNFVNLVADMDRRGLIERRPHPHDRRALGLHLTPAGHRFVAQAEEAVIQLEQDASARLTERERDTLIRLLQKIYL